MRATSKDIITCIDKYLEKTNQTETTAVEAASVLDAIGLLKDSISRPGKPLRDRLRNGDIPHAYQINSRWFIPHSDMSHKKIKNETNTFKFQQTHINAFNKKELIDINNFRHVGNLDKTSIPDTPGIYSIRINDASLLPQEFQKELRFRNDTLIYIGKAEVSLRKRLWEQELHAKGHGTFFRTIGAVLGFVPPKGSLRDKANKNNYKFSSEDSKSIIKWIEDSLSINFIEYNGEIKDVEKRLIEEFTPLMNIKDNPKVFYQICILRDKCREIARG